MSDTHLAAIREAAHDQQKIWSLVHRSIMNSETGAYEMMKRADQIMHFLDAAEKDGTCKIVMKTVEVSVPWGCGKEPGDDHWVCDKCGFEYQGMADVFCPGCGRRIERQEQE